MQFFGTADVLEVFQNKHPQLEDCEPTKNFCRRIKSLLDAMNGKSALAGMAPNNAAYNVNNNILLSYFFCILFLTVLYLSIGCRKFSRVFRKLEERCK